MKCEIKNGILDVSGFEGVEEEMVLMLSLPDIVMYSKKQFEELCVTIDALGGSEKAKLFKRKIMASAEICKVKNNKITLPECFKKQIKDGEYEAEVTKGYTEIKKQVNSEII